MVYAIRESPSMMPLIFRKHLTMSNLPSPNGKQKIWKWPTKSVRYPKATCEESRPWAEFIWLSIKNYLQATIPPRVTHSFANRVWNVGCFIIYINPWLYTVHRLKILMGFLGDYKTITGILLKQSVDLLETLRFVFVAHLVQDAANLPLNDGDPRWWKTVIMAVQDIKVARPTYPIAMLPQRVVGGETLPIGRT